MLLFLTREAFCRRSMDDRRVGEGDPERALNGVFSELKLRFCQNRRGDVAPSSGDDWNGDESVLRFIFCCVLVSNEQIFHHQEEQERQWVCLTLEGWFQLGELRRFSIGDSSDSGRGTGFAIFAGDDVGVSLDSRSGWTCEHVLLSALRKRDDECLTVINMEHGLTESVVSIGLECQK